MRAGFVVVLLLGTGRAFPEYQDDMPNGRDVLHNGQRVGGVGHKNRGGGGQTNQFGDDFVKARFKWTKELCEKDSDGDGLSNGEELGDPECVWNKGDKPSRTEDISHPGMKTNKGGSAPAVPGRQQSTSSNKRALNMIFNNSGEARLAWLMATRAVWSLVLLLWVSTRFDATLVVAVVSASITTLVLPFLSKLEPVAEFLPGVGISVDLYSLAEPLVAPLGRVLPAGWSPHAAAGLSSGVLLSTVGMTLGLWLSKRSPAAALVVYSFVMIANVQSGFFDDYPARLSLPVLVALLSIKSRHVRYLNLAALVSVVLVLAAGETDTPAVTLPEVVPVALWSGFALLLAHDMLVRCGAVEFVRKIFESCVLVYACAVVTHLLARELYAAGDIIPAQIRALLDKNALEWPDVISAQCLPACAARFEAALPGVFASAFCVITMLRSAIGQFGVATLPQNMLVAAIICWACFGFLYFVKRERMLIRTDVTAVLAAFCLVVTDKLNKRKAGKKARKEIKYHKIQYWVNRREVFSEEQSKLDAQAAVISGSVAQQSSTGSSISSDAELKQVYAIIGNDYRQLEHVRKLHKRLRTAAFQQESMISAYGASDDKSRSQAQTHREKAEQLTVKSREASAEIKRLEETILANETRAKAFEQTLLQTSKKNQ